MIRERAHDSALKYCTSCHVEEVICLSSSKISLFCFSPEG